MESLMRRLSSLFQATVILSTLLIGLYPITTQAVSNGYQTARITPVEAGTNDQFGFSVGFSGNQFIANSPLDTDGHPTTNHRGTVYIYTQNQNGQWSYVIPTLTGLPNQNNNQSSYYLYDVDIDDNTAVIGDIFDENSTTDASGAIHALKYDSISESWVDAKIKASNGEYLDNFGARVDVESNRILTSSPRKRGPNDVNGWGGGYIYDYNDATDLWEETILPNPSMYAQNVSFGNSISLSGDKAILSSRPSSPYNEESVFLYERQTNGSWAETHRFTPTEPQVPIPDVSPDRNYGFSIDVDDNIVAVGAHTDNSTGVTQGDAKGSVYVYEQDVNGNWHESKILPPETAANPLGRINFGESVVINGDRLLIGASRATGANVYSGAAYEYKRNIIGEWEYIKKYIAQDGVSSDNFGSEVKYEGTRVVISAPYATYNGGPGKGAVYVFEPDTIPPTIGTPQLNPSPIATGSNTTLTVSVSDLQTGVADGEYFINTDPGVGSATSMSLSGNTLSSTFGSSLSPGIYTIGTRARDGDGNWSNTSSVELIVDGTAPIIGPPTLSDNPISLGTSTTLSVTASDPETGIARVEYYFTNNDPGVGLGYQMSYTNGTATATIGSNLASGVYEIGVRAQNNTGQWSETTMTVLVVYDTSASSAGAGWIIPGGSTSDAGDNLPSMDGSKAQFGFSVRYTTTTQTVPTGQIKFKFKTGDFEFESTSISWLIVSNGNTTSFRGLATLAGQTGSYPFEIVASSLNGDDHLVIKLWSPGSNPDTSPYLYKASGDVGGGTLIFQ